MIGRLLCLVGRHDWITFQIGHRHLTRCHRTSCSIEGWWLS